jgi:hypothetical protein
LRQYKALYFLIREEKLKEIRKTKYISINLNMDSAGIKRKRKIELIKKGTRINKVGEGDVLGNDLWFRLKVSLVRIATFENTF